MHSVSKHLKTIFDSKPHISGKPRISTSLFEELKQAQVKIKFKTSNHQSGSIEITLIHPVTERAFAFID